MRPMFTRWLALVVTISLGAVAALSSQDRAPARMPDVIFVPTPPEIVQAMLRLAGVTEHDVVFDLGSGDGRIPILAATMFHARAVGIELDPALVASANAKAVASGVADRVTFLNADFFAADISEATVVTLYLVPYLNLRLVPKLMKELKPGTRIVSHEFDFGDWKPDRTIEAGGRHLHLWTKK